MVGQFLKQADKFLLKHDFDAAEKEVAKALELEPNNLYARAYRGRIDVLRKEFEVKRKRDEEQQRVKEKQAQLAQSSAAELTQTAAPEAIEEYKKQLYRSWSDGVATPQERASLERTRKRLSISEPLHTQLEQEIRLKCYVDAVRAAMEAGTISPLKVHALEELRKRFNVSVEEHLTVEGRMLWELQHKQHRATIMIIDDETDLVAVFRDSLSSHGYSVMTAQSPEEALQLLESNVPDLIISDIQFPGSQLDGFSIYKQVRTKRELVAVPFIFITGVADEWVRRQGLEIGADDFISKPFTMTTILSVIEGKLQRYEELKKAFR